MAGYKFPKGHKINSGKVQKEEHIKKRVIANTGKKRSPETIQRMREAKNPGQFKKGTIPWIKNNGHSDKSREKMSISQKRRFENISGTNKGKIASSETLKKLSEAHKGYIMPLSQREKIRDANKGEKSYWYGKHPSEESKKKNSEKHKGMMAGPRHWNWQDGKSFEPYTVDWTNTLKRAIRERDKYTCAICHQEGRDVHHIDYCKENCSPFNLITLCHVCHTKTNNNRAQWISYFRENIKW